MPPRILYRGVEVPAGTFIDPDKSWIVDFLQTIGEQISGPDLIAPAQRAPPKSYSLPFNTVGEKIPHLRIGGINGINTSFDEAISHALYLGKFAANHSIDWVYNSSNGSVIDVAEALMLNYKGFSPITSELLVSNWTAFHQENQSRPDAKYLQFCHSQGAIHVRNALSKASEKISERVVVVAIAPASVVLKNTCWASYNYASKKDLIPYYGQLMGERVINYKLNQGELVLVEPDPDATGIDHDFESKTFRDIIEKAIKKYLDQGGEWK